MYGTDETGLADDAFGFGPVMKMTKAELKMMEEHQMRLMGRLPEDAEESGRHAGKHAQNNPFMNDHAPQQHQQQHQGGGGGGGFGGDGGFGGAGGGEFDELAAQIAADQLAMGGGGGGGGMAMPRDDLAGDQIAAFIVRFSTLPSHWAPTPSLVSPSPPSLPIRRRPGRSHALSFVPFCPFSQEQAEREAMAQIQAEERRMVCARLPSLSSCLVHLPRNVSPAS